MKVRNMHAYDPDTLEYKGMVPTTLDPRASELEGHDVWMIPANATDIGPDLSSVGEHQICVFDPKHNKWDIVPDFRGTEVYNAKTREFNQWNAIGEIPAWCYTFDKMPYSRTVMYWLDWTEEGLVIDTHRESVLESIKEHRKVSRDLALLDNIVFEGNEYKSTSQAQEDYVRIITLDITVMEWVTASGNKVVMTPKLAKTLLEMIQNRKDIAVNKTANLIEKDKTASSNQLIKQLDTIYPKTEV